MASDPAVVVYDACVLYPFHLRNLLIQLAVEGLVAARWTDAIHDEWIRSLANTGDVSRERLLATRDLMKSVLPEADIRDYKRHEGTITLPDPNDHHVLAAAIEFARIDHSDLEPQAFSGVGDGQIQHYRARPRQLSHGALR